MNATLRITAARTLKTLLGTLLLLASATAPSGAQAVVQSIAAVVNSDIISSRDVTSRIGLAILISGLPDDPATKQRLVPQVLRGLIDERLQLQEAARMQLTVSDKEIDAAFTEIAQRNKMTPAQLSQFIASKNVDPASVREQLRAQVAWLKVVNRTLRGRVTVTRDQIDLALKSRRAADQELLMSEILLPIYDNAKAQDVVAQARDLIAAIRGGADFSALARQLSSTPSAEAGGDLGWVRLSAVTPELQSTIAGLQPGQISEPIRTPAGIHIVEVRDRRQVAAQAIETDADRQQVRQQLEEEQLQRLATSYLRDLRRTAFIDVRLKA